MITFWLHLNWLLFKTRLNQSVIDHIPHKTAKQKDSLPWITPNISKFIRRRDRLYNNKKKSADPKITSKFKEVKRISSCIFLCVSVISSFMVSQLAFLYNDICLGFCFLDNGLVSISLKTMSWSDTPDITWVRVKCDGLFGIGKPEPSNQIQHTRKTTTNLVSC
jgi:hypothetical protein